MEFNFEAALESREEKVCAPKSDHPCDSPPLAEHHMKFNIKVSLETRKEKVVRRNLNPQSRLSPL